CAATACAAGNYLDVASCSSCPAGSSCAGGSNAPAQCAAGSYAAAGATSCASCAAGMKTCTSPNGYASTCSAGYYKNGNACTACAAGKYSTDGNTATSCTSCAAGMKTCTSPNGYASTCSAGYYKNGNACTACAAGTYSTDGNTATSCTSCAAGTFSAAGAKSCTSCAAGMKTCTSPNGYASTCKAGFYKSGNTCKSCAVGTYSSDNNTASACTNCSGYSSKVATCDSTTGGAKTCQAGYELSGTSGASGTKCNLCAAGKYRNSVGTTCSTCTGYPSKVATCNPKTGAVIDCAAGYTLSDGACVAIDFGKSCSDNGVTNWGNMQNFGTTQCNAMTKYGGTEYMFAGAAGGSLSGVNTVCVKDSRNSQAYRVRRMPDGKCWMIDNLKYAGGSYKDPASASSTYCTTNNNVSSPFTGGKWPNSTTGCGYLYAWETATTGSGNSTGGTSGGSVICPSGWTLPANGVYMALHTAIGGDGLSYGGGLAFQAPYSGYYYGSRFNSQSTNGSYWNSTEYSGGSGNAYSMYFSYTSGLYSSNYTDKAYYYAVRCYR
ncbi:MAG: hypothetical protein LBE20_03300, partial [Deltaproteobacteria bacterium]|nr:hypothetical protein [Deltaproteobacteria bacterium]